MVVWWQISTIQKKGAAPVTAKVALNADAKKFVALLMHNLGKKELDN